MARIAREVEVQDPIGLHARPAGQIVKLVKDSGLEIQIGRPGEESAKANSALRLMALKIKHGEKLLVEIETDDHDLAETLLGQIQVLLKG